MPSVEVKYENCRLCRTRSQLYIVFQILNGKRLNGNLNIPQWQILVNMTTDNHAEKNEGFLSKSAVSSPHANKKQKYIEIFSPIDKLAKLRDM